jgi:uncharacterized membrane protein (DUF106 family)
MQAASAVLRILLYAYVLCIHQGVYYHCIFYKFFLICAGNHRVVYFHFYFILSYTAVYFILSFVRSLVLEQNLV